MTEYSEIRVAVIEDNRGDFFLIEEYLIEVFERPDVWQYETFSDAQNTLFASEPFDVILLDLSLPDAEGEELVYDILKLAGGIPVIVLTGYSDKDFGLKTLSMGVSDYLLKDELDAEQLKRSILYSTERKRVHNKLQESEKQYKHLFDLNPLPVWVQDRQTLKILDVNRAAIDHYGYSKSEFLEMSIPDIVVTDENGKLPVNDITSQSTDKSGKVISKHKKRNDEIIDVEIRVTEIEFESRPALLVIADDITEKLKVEEELKQSEQRFKSLVQEGSDLIAILDEDANYKYVAPSTKSILGIPAEVFIGRNAFEHIHEDDHERLLKILENLPQKKSFHISPYQFRDSENNWRWLETTITNLTEHPAVKGLVANSRDITERKREEERLKLLESVITNTNESVVILEAIPTSMPGRKIIYVNDAFTKMTGYRSEEVIGQTLHFLNGPKTDDRERLKLRKKMEHWEPVSAELINYKKNGDEFWVHLSMVPVADNNGTFTHWISIGRDVTIRRNQEEEIRRSLKEKDILLAEIHHRVKNNLAVISAMLQLQAAQNDNKELTGSLFDSIVRIKTIANIHEHLYKSRSFSEINFSKNIQELVNKIVEASDRQSPVEFEYNCENVSLNVNQAIPCSLIINEVITNSLKHAFKELTHKKAIISIDLKLLNSTIHLSINDNGSGIPEDILNRDGDQSLGLQIISVLSQQLKADYSYNKNNPDATGTHFHVSFKKANIKGTGTSHLQKSDIF